MLTKFLYFQKIWSIVLICFWVLTGALSAQEKPKSGDNGIFQKCFELPQKFLIKTKYASDKVLGRDARILKGESAKTGDIIEDVFVTGEKTDSGSSNASSENTELTELFESWNSAGDLNWKIPYFSQSEKFYILGGNIYSLKLVEEGKTSLAGGLSIREISVVTGLTLWQRTFRTKTTDAAGINDFEVEKLGNSLLIIEKKKGVIYFVSGDNGNLNSSQEFSRPLKVFSDNSADYLFFSDSQNTLYQAKLNKDSDSGFSITKLPSIQFDSEITNLRYILEENSVYVTDSTGTISKVSLNTTKNDWKYQTGASIAAFTFYKDRLLAISLDNFAYYLERKNGRRIWKKRLPGRSLETPIITGESVIIPVFGDPRAVILDISKGRQTGQISLYGEEYFTETAQISTELIFLNTSGGVKAYGRNGVCPKK